MIHPCPLCGTIHKLSIHAIVQRLIRNNQTYTNEIIDIIVIICHDSKTAGKQYTKRILPPFIIPECNITLENSFELIETYPQKSLLDIDHACQILGTDCERTVRRHYELVTEYINKSSTLLTFWLAQHPMTSQFPVSNPSDSSMAFFMTIYECLIAAEVKQHGDVIEAPAPLIFPGYLMGMQKLRKPLKTPSNLYAIIRWYFDTS